MTDEAPKASDAEEEDELTEPNVGELPSDPESRQAAVTLILRKLGERSGHPADIERAYSLGYRAAVLAQKDERQRIEGLPLVLRLEDRPAECKICCRPYCSRRPCDGGCGRCHGCALLTSIGLPASPADCPTTTCPGGDHPFELVADRHGGHCGVCGYGHPTKETTPT